MVDNGEGKKKEKKNLFHFEKQKEDNITKNFNGIISRSNQNLIFVNSKNNNNENNCLSLEKIPFVRNKEKNFSIKIPKLDLNKNEILHINSESNNEKNNKEKFKSKIIGKKLNIFSKHLDERKNLLIELLDEFKSKILEIHNKLNLFINTNDREQIQNSFRLLNLNKISIFEKKINDFFAKRILFYMKIINNIDSYFSNNNNFNFDFLNDFYKDLAHEENNIVNTVNKAEIKSKQKEIESVPYLKNEEKYFDSIKNKNNILVSHDETNIKKNDSNSYFEKKHLNTERNNKINSKFRKLLLPPLNNIIFSENQLNPNSFRNSQKIKNSLSTNKSQNKHSTLKLKQNNNIELNEHNNINSNLKEEEKIKKDLENNNNLILKKNSKRKSIVALTVPNYQNINNVNDYILNYNQIKKENVEKEKNSKNKSKEKINNLKIINTELKLKDNKNENYEENLNQKSREMINLEDNNISKEEGFKSEKSESYEEKSKNDEKKKLEMKNESSFDSKDPLDDVKYLTFNE